MSQAARETMARIIVEEYGDLIERVAYTLVKDAHLAEDVKQDVLMKLFSMENDILDRPTPVIKRYLFVMAKNRAIDIIKERTKEEEALISLQDSYVGIVEGADKLAFMDEKGLSQDIQEVMNYLDQIDRDIICLRYGDGFSFKEIAKIIDKSEDFVYQRVKRARDKLKAMLLKGGFSYE